MPPHHPYWPPKIIFVPFGKARLSSGSMGRAREVIKWFREHQEGMELIKAVREQDVEKVKVRRPLEAASSTEHGPSRGVSLGLGQWTLDAVVARPIRPCCADSTRLRHAPLMQFRFCLQALLRAGHDAKFREPYAHLPAHLPYCRISQCLSTSFPRNRRDFLKFGTFDGCASAGARWRVLRVLSEHSFR